MPDPRPIGEVVREAGWEPQDGPEPQQGADLSLVDVMMKLDELHALVKLVYGFVKPRDQQPAQAAPPRQYAPRQAPQGQGGGGGGYGRRQGPPQGGGGYNPPNPPHMRQGPPRNQPAPGDGFPQAEEQWFDGRLLDQQIAFGKKWRGFRWGDLLASDEGRQYLDWLVGQNVQQNGRNPNGWQGMAGRAALWCLAFGDRYAQQGPPQQGDENVPF
jgi:hypothetical protein